MILTSLARHIFSKPARRRAHAPQVTAAMESLENRCLLSGTVAAEVVNDPLEIGNTETEVVDAIQTMGRDTDGDSSQGDDKLEIHLLSVSNHITRP